MKNISTFYIMFQLVMGTLAIIFPISIYNINLGIYIGLVMVELATLAYIRQKGILDMDLWLIIIMVISCVFISISNTGYDEIAQNLVQGITYWDYFFRKVLACLVGMGHLVYQWKI
ncbi:MAG: hypothetical protein Q4A81_07515 [Pasteurellaceae bacterium]|nr:hypothetical protein [Pasteurellaceae bacterium]